MTIDSALALLKPPTDAAFDPGQKSLAVLAVLTLAACGGGSTSPGVPSAPATAPAAPTALVAVAGNAQVSLSWTASPGATGYSVLRATASGGPYTPLATPGASPYVDSSATNGTAYFYVAIATNATGASANSNEATATPVAAAKPMSRNQAARFLAQAAFGGSAQDIQNLLTIPAGIPGWLSQQFSLPVNPAGQLSNVNWMLANNLNLSVGSAPGPQASFWRKLISSPDVLRQRIMLALTDLFVINTGATQLPFPGVAIAYYLDQLEANAFGTYRNLLLALSRTPAMGQYLTFLNSVKANPMTGTSPDENYAREIMQLFSIGVVLLNLDGSPVPNPAVPGVALATYAQVDVLNLAKVFTGWTLDAHPTNTFLGAHVATDMVNDAAAADSSEKTILGQTIAAGLTGEQSLEAAIDILMSHPNLAPFVSRQLIQRLVMSSPPPDFVLRVASVFVASHGDMKAVITAILTDPAASSDTALTDPQAGKLREPVVRFLQWARTFSLNFAPATSAQWSTIGDLSSASNGLAESPLTSPNVFFFFQPGYVPPQTDLQTQNLTAPEFALINETSVAGYMNFIKHLIANGVGGVAGDYSAVLPLVNQGGNSAALLAELNVVLAAGQISSTTLTMLQAALDSIDVSTAIGTNDRLYAALTLIYCAPEYLVQK